MNSFDDWVLKNFEKISLEIHDLSWVHDFFPELSDFSSEIKWNGRTYIGRSTREKESAVRVSLIEAIERAVCIGNQIETTNGVAAHFSQDRARLNARNELLERDLFLSHFITQTPFRRIGNVSVPNLRQSMNFIEKADDSVAFFKMRPSNLGQGFLCVISGSKRWGGIIGLSFGDDSEENLIFKAFLEAFRQYWHLSDIQGLTQSLSIEEFLRQEKWTFDDHRRLALNVAYFDQIRDLFSDDDKAGSREVQYSQDELAFHEISLEAEPFSSCPIVVSQCKGQFAQKLYVGPFEESRISSKGLSRFLGHEPQSLNTLPHPLS